MRTEGQGPGGFEKRDGSMRPGQDLVMAGYTGLAGTVKIWEEKREELLLHFPEGFFRSLGEPGHFEADQWIKGEQREKNSSFTAFEYAGEGGVLAALWNFSGVFHAGIDVDLRQLPMKQVTVEVCEFFELNPYRLDSSGCLLLASDHGLQLVKRLKEQGIEAQVIGMVTEGEARQIRHGAESAGFLERPRPDELYRILGGSSGRS